ncbi:hypothetical protein KY363_01890 [Candidatus Woesearchaeota archaeon]|nr:hypothetical protein [Candidatus Woesearchaeota archaeon]
MAEEIEGLELKEELIREDPKRYIELYLKLCEEAAKIASGKEFQMNELASKLKKEAEHEETVLRVGAAKFKLDLADKLMAEKKEKGAKKLAEEAYEILHPPTPASEEKALQDKASAVLDRLRGYLGDKVKPTRAPAPPEPKPAEPSPKPATPTPEPTRPAPKKDEPGKDWKEFAGFTVEDWLKYFRANGPDKTAFKLAEVAYHLTDAGEREKALRLVTIARRIKPEPGEEAMEEVEKAEAAAEKAPEQPVPQETPPIITPAPSGKEKPPADKEKQPEEKKKDISLDSVFYKSMILKMKRNDKGELIIADDRLLDKIAIDSNNVRKPEDMGAEFAKLFREAAELIEKIIASAKDKHDDVKKAVLEWLEKKKDLLDIEARKSYVVYKKVFFNPHKKPENEAELRVAKLLAAKEAISKLEEIAGSV